MQNLTQNRLEQIAKMLNLSRNELEQIARMRCIRNYKNMSKDGLLIALLKSGRSFADNAEIEKTGKCFNELTDKFSRSKIEKIRKEFYKIENNENLSR